MSNNNEAEHADFKGGRTKTLGELIINQLSLGFFNNIYL